MSITLLRLSASSAAPDLVTQRLLQTAVCPAILSVATVSCGPFVWQSQRQINSLFYLFYFSQRNICGPTYPLFRQTIGKRNNRVVTAAAGLCAKQPVETFGFLCPGVC